MKIVFVYENIFIWFGLVGLKICFVESWICCDSAFKIPGFSLFQKDYHSLQKREILGFNLYGHYMTLMCRMISCERWFASCTCKTKIGFQGMALFLVQSAIETKKPILNFQGQVWLYFIRRTTPPPRVFRFFWIPQKFLLKSILPRKYFPNFSTEKNS